MFLVLSCLWLLVFLAMLPLAICFWSCKTKNKPRIVHVTSDMIQLTGKHESELVNVFAQHCFGRICNVTGEWQPAKTFTSLTKKEHVAPISFLEWWCKPSNHPNTLVRDFTRVIRRWSLLQDLFDIVYRDHFITKNFFGSFDTLIEAPRHSSLLLLYVQDLPSKFSTWPVFKYKHDSDNGFMAYSHEGVHYLSLVDVCECLRQNSQTKAIIWCRQQPSKILLQDTNTTYQHIFRQNTSNIVFENVVKNKDMVFMEEANVLAAARNHLYFTSQIRQCESRHYWYGVGRTAHFLCLVQCWATVLIVMSLLACVTIPCFFLSNSINVMPVVPI